MVAIFPKLCFWRRSLCSNLGGIDPEKLSRATLSLLELVIKTPSIYVKLPETPRWLDTVFQGQYLASLSINYVATNKHLEKIATVVLDKDENLL